MKLLFSIFLTIPSATAIASDCSNFSGLWTDSSIVPSQTVEIRQQACKFIRIQGGSWPDSELNFSSPTTTLFPEGDRRSSITRMSTWIDGKTKVITDEQTMSAHVDGSYMQAGTIQMELLGEGTIRITEEKTRTSFYQGKRDSAFSFRVVTDLKRQNP